MSRRECKHPNCESTQVYLDGLCYTDFKRADRIRGEGATVADAGDPKRPAGKRPAKKAPAKRGGRK